jgi:hypothetical protein
MIVIASIAAPHKGLRQAAPEKERGTGIGVSLLLFF